MRLLKVAAAAAVLLGSSMAVAGSYYTQPVSFSGNSVQGVIRDARYSSSGIEFIGCDVRANGLVSCYMKDAAGTYKNCSTTASGFQTAAAGIGGNSYVYIAWDAGGTCTYLQVYNTSVYYD